MPDEIRTCIDVFPDPQPKTATERMALVQGKSWGSGWTLRIRFLEGDAAVQAKVKAVAKKWLDFANIYFAFVDAEPSHVRIGFAKGAGSWSLIGKDSLTIKNVAMPTMNLGWLTPETPDHEYSRVVLHEFGHALGCIHEHQHPAAGIDWNKPAVYDYYKKTNGWDQAKVDKQIFDAYDRNLLVSTKAADPQSIMMYPIPPGFANNLVVGWNEQLSATDQTFIRSVYV